MKVIDIIVSTILAIGALGGLLFAVRLVVIWCTEGWNALVDYICNDPKRWF